MHRLRIVPSARLLVLLWMCSGALLSTGWLDVSIHGLPRTSKLHVKLHGYLASGVRRGGGNENVMVLRNANQDDAERIGRAI